MPRHFFAIWPDATAAQALEALGRELAERCGGKPVAIAKIHLTLAFLGEIATERVDAAAAAGARMRTAPFDLAFDTVGWFRAARVAWAGSSRPTPRLLEFQDRLDESLRALGFALDSRPYTPHLTLARRANRPVAPAPIVPIEWRASELRLMRSETGTGRYATVASWGFDSG